MKRHVVGFGWGATTRTWEWRKIQVVALLIKGHSEKSRKFDLNPFKRLADISECRAEGRADRQAEGPFSISACV
jgi:hypothetical protein